MTDQNAQTQAHTFTEAPASWNVKYTLRGYECMLTIRAESAGAPAGEQHAYEVIPVNTVAHVVSEKGHHSLKVKGGKYSKFGVTAWTEVIPVEGWETWDIGAEYAPPAGMEYATVQDGKKVTQFRATQQ